MDGWTCIKGITKEDRRVTAINERILEIIKENKDLIITDYAKKGNVLYIAVRNIQTCCVTAYIVITAINNDELKYRIIKEEEGPLHIDCPQRILKILTETTGEEALKWRMNCWEEHVKNRGKSYKEGDILEFPSEHCFADGTTSKRFVLIKRGRLFFFIPYKENQLEDNTCCYYIRSWRKEKPEIIGNIKSGFVITSGVKIG